MCGVFGFRMESPRELADRFGLDNLPKTVEDLMSLKIVPKSRIATVSRNSPNQLVERVWGLVPGWIDNPDRVRFSSFNARVETVRSKPVYRNAWKKKQRCLIPSSYFVEWETKRDGATGKVVKQPYKVWVKGESEFAFAGLYELWDRDKSREPVLSCTMLTTKSVPPLSGIHERQPVILNRADEERWLDRTVESEELVGAMEPREDLEMREIGAGFNKLRADEVDMEMMM